MPRLQGPWDEWLPRALGSVRNVRRYGAGQAPGALRVCLSCNGRYRARRRSCWAVSPFMCGFCRWMYLCILWLVRLLPWGVEDNTL